MEEDKRTVSIRVVPMSRIMAKACIQQVIKDTSE